MLLCWMFGSKSATPSRLRVFQTSDPRSLDGFEPKPVVLAKPFSPDKLVAAIRNLLGNPLS